MKYIICLQFKSEWTDNTSIWAFMKGYKWVADNNNNFDRYGEWWICNLMDNTEQIH